MIAVTRAFGLLLAICLIGQEVRGLEDKCSFNSENYSLRWRYEKSTNNVIFFLKTSGNGDNFWSGIGFGDRKQNVSSDFISVFVKNGQFGLADMHLGKTDQLFADTFTNVQVISFDVEKGKLMAQFSRSLTAMDEDDVDLKGCTKFFFPVKPISTKDSDMKELKESDLQSKVICDIDKECEIDDSAVPSGDSDKKVEFAESVDVSGTGDPCSFKGETYNVSWKYDKKLDTVNFSMQVPMKGGKWWSAVGIGDTMQDMDIFALFLDNGLLKSHGDFFSSGYTVPSKDDSQDWEVDEKEAKVVDGTVHLKFSRKLETEDKKNDRSLDGCVLFQFAANLGKYGSKFSIRKHEDWPDLYKACGLKQNCAARSRRNRPRFAQQRDEAIQSVETSGEEPEERFTTTETSPAEMVDAQKVEAPLEAVNPQKIALPQTEQKTPDTPAETASPEKAPVEEDGVKAAAAPAEGVAPQQVPLEEKPAEQNVGAPPQNATVEEAGAKSEEQGETVPPQKIVVQQVEDAAPQTPAEAVVPQNSSLEADLLSSTVATPVQPITAAASAEASSEPPASPEASVQASTEAPQVPAEASTEAPAAPQVPAEVATDASAVPSAEEAATNSSSAETTTEAPTTSTTTEIPTTEQVAETSTTTAEPSTTSEAAASPETAVSVAGNAVAEEETEAPATTTSAATTTKAPATSDEECEEGHEDLPVCKNYIDEYFGEVKEWAQKHNETVQAQAWKACSLLQKVAHVPSLCCTSFLAACRNHLPPPQPHSGLI
ncbi:hypothetical protein QR680_010661 [Steinernema hermaphroditum]|uniref:DOMON domain-containing protein n=1 Tax=Steinernema hermaphroditum TaxID=289476 RepID=A0AA39IRI8_9BILA|nr:hypothetical protein QR680_010661 [Steinernema hermaphroditum]